MDTVAFYLLLIPLLVMAAKFWIGVMKWGVKNQRSLVRRVQRIRAAVAAANREE